MKHLLLLILFCFSLQGLVLSQEYYTVADFVKNHKKASDKLISVRGEITKQNFKIKSLEQNVHKLNVEKNELVLQLSGLDKSYEGIVEKKISDYKKKDEFETQAEYSERILNIDSVIEKFKKQISSQMSIDDDTQKIDSLNRKIEQLMQVMLKLSDDLSDMKVKASNCTTDMARFAQDKIIEVPYIYVLSRYDADGEFFVLSRKGSASLLASVPRKEARLFKTAFDTIKIYSHPYNSVAIVGDNQYILTKFELIDPRDNKQYRIVKVESQIWMAENLAYETKKKSYPYGKDESNVEKYGRLYSWETIEEACPAGWHVPSDLEWKILEKAIGMTDSELDLTGERGTGSGAALKSEDGWKSGGNGLNKYGLNFLPAGIRGSKGNYASLEIETRVWSSTELDSKNAYSRGLIFFNDKITRSAQKKDMASSVRCIKN
ncbi:fibrobacter succinogenes major paralogous domain-containing protein [Ancylomarina sp. 16SWW S1-10-2]|uniref:fibrobacter succinogenes major paralogous domain-containing protein n=1 Tax=Ancylomarina sp. 16SWW S1-10-2 TaxID=2499681 RepID=UPI0012AD87D2|nr:fibrobacter succinogenes major paralogous domain-containing protein [Ancylomarina sp. 16SWW S1-10-2]MRT91855.1 hypothetical protein [Ancylomarina sp. 16SWW S1-10-2]